MKKNTNWLWLIYVLIAVSVIMVFFIVKITKNRADIKNITKILSHNSGKITKTYTAIVGITDGQKIICCDRCEVLIRKCRAIKRQEAKNRVRMSIYGRGYQEKYIRDSYYCLDCIIKVNKEESR